MDENKRAEEQRAPDASAPRRTPVPAAPAPDADASRPPEVARAGRANQPADPKTAALPDITQVGQVLREQFNKMARPPLGAPARRPETPQQQRAPVSNGTRERVATLVAALGDPEHALHQQAIAELVQLGDVAVPALNEALNPRRSWLTNYRAAEALGQIGDGRATGPLIEALRNANSNVRWGAVRALAEIGDARALLDLRRVVRDDQGKTSWGESVSGAAQSAIKQMRSQNVLLRGAELVQTALACVLMLVALILAWSVITSLRAELSQTGRETITPITQAQAQAEGATAPTGVPADAAGAAASTTEPEAPQPTGAPTAAVNQITVRVLTTANVRAAPSVATGQRVGTLNAGDTLIVEASTEDRAWYRVRLDTNASSGSRITTADGSAWISRSLIAAPSGTVPVEEADAAAPTAAPTETP